MAELEDWSAEVKRGGTKLGILQLLGEADRYGYELVTLLKARTDGQLSLADANVYPALHSLERSGFVEAYWKEMDSGVPARKYYRITSLGKRHHVQMVDRWRSFVAGVNQLIHKGGRKA